MSTPVREYIKCLRENLQGGDATEHTHRPALKILLESISKDVTATNEPQRIKCGAPDFSISRSGVPLGYVETKDPHVNLSEMERGRGPSADQFRRYSALPNWVLTNYLEFHWYVGGRRRLVAQAAEFDANGKLKLKSNGEVELDSLLRAFYDQPALTVGTAKELAVRMAGMTRMIRDLILASFGKEAEETELRRIREATDPIADYHSSRGPWLHMWLSAFRATLVPSLTEPEFADMFAQTLAYGLFAARVHAPVEHGFSREMAAFRLPRTNPFLRKLFSEIAGVDMPDTISWAVEDLVSLLRHADMAEILRDFSRGKGIEDPVVHFYETFLAEYAPGIRELRGVYYTPRPVVSYIVRSINYALQTSLGCPLGLADENALILDFATGTATFLHFAIAQIRTAMSHQLGGWDSYVSSNLLHRIFGFELLMAPYAIAHLKLGMQLEESGYRFGTDERLGVYLTNTLEEAAQKSEQLIGSWVAEEANSAAAIKRDRPIMVVMGNPPYSGVSANTGVWIEDLMTDYKTTVRQEERQLQRLSNDYVKFIRFGQWRIQKTGKGILGVITDNGYLNGILFRDMRHSLLNSFSRIYILNLHGVAVRGSSKNHDADENVFDITQGVAISVFIRDTNAKAPATVFYADLRGTRKSKYEVLSATDLSTTEWHEITPTHPHWYFTPTSWNPEYSSWPSFMDLIGTGNPRVDRDRLYGTGIKTRHDGFVIGWTPEDAVARIQRIARREETDEQLKNELNLCTTAHFDLGRARVRAQDPRLYEYVRPVVYRPFDRRYFVYLREFVCEPKLKTMRHLLHPENIAMGVLRRDRKGLSAGFFVFRGLVAKDAVSNLDDALVWPLYVYPEHRPNEPSFHSEDEPRPNLSPPFLKTLSERLRLPQTGPHGLPEGVTPEDIFHYIYAVLHSHRYRNQYSEFLGSDYPRIPLTSNRNLFCLLATLGKKIVALHLMEVAELDYSGVSFPATGTCMVDLVKYTSEDQRVWVNGSQYFDGITESTWLFHVGKYQVCKTWLENRKGRKLDYRDIAHYRKVAATLRETIEAMDGVDQAIPSWPLP